MSLVEIKKNNVYCDTVTIAHHFKIQHSKVIRTMETLIKKINDYKTDGFNPDYFFDLRVYRGREYTAYLLNKDCFILLAMRFDTKQARSWQGKFIAAFNAMEEQLLIADKNASDPKWLQQREEGKIARREETDVIKEFVEYATAQGSKNAKFYYKHITNSTYKALDLLVQKKPKLRDTLNFYELAELLLAERVARNSIKKYMELERNYKDIYESVKIDLENFGQALRLTGDFK